MCVKCREIQNEWLRKAIYGYELKPDFAKRFNRVYGKGQYDKAFIFGEVNLTWSGICRKCKTAFIMQKAKGVD